jgi:sugar (pentulose or hexulose) kinase
MALLLGIDKGTSVVKTVAFSLDGQEIGSAERRIVVLRPFPGAHEEDPRATWALCVETIREALKKAHASGSDVLAIGVTAHMGGAWLVDAEGEPTRNAICWPDARAQDDLVALERSGEMECAFAVSGSSSMPGITALALGWLARNESESLIPTKTVLLAKDFLRLKLTGSAATDPSDITFIPGDIDARDYSAEIFRLCGAQAWLDRMPRSLDSGAIAGTVTCKAAAETGLREGTPVITGLGDACANAVGIGAIDVGTAFTALGTSCLNSQVIGDADRAPAGLGFTFAMPLGRYLRILPNTSGTITMDWFLDRFGGPKTAAGRWDFETMERRAEAIPPGAEGVILLPYANGAGVLAPFCDIQARGGIFGVSTHSTRDHLLRAVYETLCYATRDCFEAMKDRPKTLTLTGGGSRSPFWAQMFADVCGITVDVSTVGESRALGVALLAGVAVGAYPDLASASRFAAGRLAVYEPRPAYAARYGDWFGLYQNLRDTYRRFSPARAALAAPIRTLAGARLA